MKKDLSQRFAFLVNDVARIYGRHFDKLAREQLGLSRAQCRLLGALSMRDGPLSQTALADKLDLTPMAVGSLCDRMETAGWIRRQSSTTDRRVNEIHLEPKAQAALEAALAISDSIQLGVMTGMSATERKQLLALLNKAHVNLLALQSGVDAA